MSCKDADNTVVLNGTNNAFVRPDCAVGAELSGVVVGVRSVFDPNGDDDVTFNMCPDATSMRIFPLQYQPVELRGYKAFQIPAPDDGEVGQEMVGRIHAEVQGCRFYDGVYSAVVPSDVNGGHDELVAFHTRPDPGDAVSIAGDWVDDTGHDFWTELHEARAIATVHSIVDAQHPVPGQMSLAFVSAFFAEESFQQDSIALDIRAPRPRDPRFTTLTCIIDQTAAIGPAHCPAYGSVPAQVVPDSNHGTCHMTLLRPRSLQPRPYACESACGMYVPRSKLRPDQVSPFCFGAGSNATCLGYFDFADLDEASQCANVQYAGVVRAEWRAP